MFPPGNSVLLLVSRNKVLSFPIFFVPSTEVVLRTITGAQEYLWVFWERSERGFRIFFPRGEVIISHSVKHITGHGHFLQCRVWFGWACRIYLVWTQNRCASPNDHARHMKARYVMRNSLPANHNNNNVYYESRKRELKI
jgi:hypothetical protein